MASAPTDKQDEIDQLKAEVAELRAVVARQQGAPDDWKGMRDLSKAIERGQLNTFLWKRSWEPWHTWFMIFVVLGILAGWTFLLMSRPH